MKRQKTYDLRKSTALSELVYATQVKLRAAGQGAASKRIVWHSLWMQIYPVIRNVPSCKFIRSKAARFGIKSYELCEARTGYLLTMAIYSGKKGTNSENQAVHGFTGASSKIVIQLMNEYFHKGHCLVMDNFYNSVTLTRFLKEQCGTDVLGTLNRRRKNTPPDIKALVEQRIKKDEIVARDCSKITVLSLKDVKLVTMISTYHNADTAPGQRAGVACNKPLVVHSYNKYMGGVALKDQKLSMYLLERKRGLKWYVKGKRKHILFL
ncbi:hypothetical protein SFRURICE_014988 [Spodoptera frugiperda]|uniref:SFRICE_024825 n=1 Tax=Spodoptera frugiperda TaxID=7108 RepID=A0A2H1W6T9_SPOFR|nr:hypothetical protein SFRURICE_014988 [Spodoptera frugiperda]